jgi:anti-sigma factor RsiW
MPTIHEEIDELLTADLHDQLTDSERQTLHSHLVECAACRQLHKEYQNMNTALNEAFEAGQPELGFEQRALSAFRQRVPDKGLGVMRFLVLATRSRPAHVAAVLAILAGLVQVGRLVTKDNLPLGSYASVTRRLHRIQGEAEPRAAAAGAVIVTGSNIPVASEEMPTDASTRAVAEVADRDTLAQRKASSVLSLEKESIFRLSKPKIAGGLVAPTKAAPAAPPTSSAEADTRAVPNELGQRKLIRNARTDLEVLSFQDTVEKITALAREAHGYLATSGSRKQENGKLRGEVVVKVLPDALDHFLEQLRGLGDLKNQNISTEDVSKQYFDIKARLDNSRVMEQRLVEMLKKNTGKVSDLLQVEKELGRVREDIEKMQGELKFMDAQVQFATVTITLAEKDMNVPAAFLLEERARLGLFTSDVEQIYNGIKALASPKVQVTQAHLESASAGQVSGRISMLIAPEESEATIAKIKQMGRVQTFEVQTERVARGGEGMSESAKTEKDKVQVDISITRQEEEQALQQTSLRIRSDDVDNKAQQLRALAEKEGGQVRRSSFNKDSEGREVADITLRLPMKNYQALMQSLGSIGKVEDVTVHREERADKITDQSTAPADVSIQVYSRGNIVSEDSGIFATIRRTLGQGAGALTWSVTMIGIALAFIAPWAIALAVIIYITRRIIRSRRNK